MTTAPLAIPVFMLSREALHALVLLQGDKNFQVFLEALELRLAGLSLGANMAVEPDRRAVMAGRVQELYDTVLAIKSASIKLSEPAWAPTRASGKVFGG